MSAKQWRPFNDQCCHCGGDAEAFTDSGQARCKVKLRTTFTPGGKLVYSVEDAAHDASAAHELLACLKAQLDFWESLPCGVDYEADPLNRSPQDANAHIAGLAVQEIRKVLETEPEGIMSDTKASEQDDLRELVRHWRDQALDIDATEEDEIMEVAAGRLEEMLTGKLST